VKALSSNPSTTEKSTVNIYCFLCQLLLPSCPLSPNYPLGFSSISQGNIPKWEDGKVSVCVSSIPQPPLPSAEILAVSVYTLREGYIYIIGVLPPPRVLQLARCWVDEEGTELDHSQSGGCPPTCL
jgi:hypothetical protein